MKKSIFLFFAAILCAMNASAWSYKSAANGWKASTSGFTTVTMNSGKSMSVVMLKDVGDGVNICQNDDGNGQKLYCQWTKTSGDIFRGTARWNSGLYSDETVVIPGGIVYIKVGSGAQVQMTAGADYTYTADVTFSTTGESYTIFGGTVNGATIKNEEYMPAGGKPSTLTMSNSYTSKKSGNVHIVFDLKTNKVTETAASEPEPEPTPEVYTVVGSSAEIFGSAWTPSATANDMTKQADGTYKLVKENVTLAASDIEYKVVKDHNWGTGEFPSPGNQSFKIDESGVYDITFTYTVGSKLTAEKTLKESAVVLPTIELAGTMNDCEDWGACKKALTPADDKLKASITVTLAQQEYSFKIVKAGEWLGNKGKMERNSSTGWTFEKLEGGDETNCRIVADIAGDYTFTWTYETNKLTVTYPELPTPEYKDITVTVYAKEVPNIWWWNGGDKCADADDAYDWDTAPAMEAVVIDGNTWYQKTFKDVDVALGGIKFKLKSQDQSKGSNELQTTEDKCYDARVIATVTETPCGQLPTGETPKVTYNVEVPAGTNTCYIAGDMNGWKFTDEMTKVDDTHYTITIEGATTAHKYKYTSGPDWAWEEVISENRTYSPNDVVAAWKSVYDPSAPTYDYYLTGSLVGGWDVKQQGIEKDGELYKATFTELNAGIYEFKITAGDWDHQWNYNNLGAAYEEVSQGVDGEGNPNGNIKFGIEEAKNITVTFNPATGKITIEGLTKITEGLTYTVETPWGTENCYIASATTGWNFRQMEPTDEDYIFTITIVGAKETDEYKYACQPNWDFAEVREADENGNTNRKAWTERDVVDEWSTLTYTVAGNNAAVFGAEWDVEIWENNMTLQEHDGTYVWTKPAVHLTDNVEFKVIKNQNWETAWPSDNYVINITESAFYSLTIYYNPANNDITVVTNKLTAQTGSLTLDGVMLEEMEYDGMNLLRLSGQNSDWTTGVTIFLENYTGEDKAYDVYYDSAIDWNYNYSSSVSGQLTQTTGADGLRTFAGTLNVVFEAYDEATDAMVGQPYELTVTLVEKSDAATVVVVTDATVTLEAGLTMTGEWTDESDGTTYPVLVTVPGFDPSVASAELEAAVTVGGEGDSDPWLGFVEGLTTVTVEDGVVKVTGVLENTWAGVKLDVTISGTLPAVEEPEVTEITLTSGDNSALLAAADGKTVDVTVERSFTAGGLHTIALPFTLTNVAGVFGEGTVVYEFAELQLENNDLVLYFDDTKTTIEAGKPYLIVPAQSVNGFEVDDATISATPQPISFTVGNATVTMEPVLTVATNATTNGKYWLASDTYLYNTSTALKSLCAVFDIQSKKSNVRARIAFNENAATGFDNIVAPEGQTIKAIVNGQLVIIRGGEMYNVQGQVIR